MKQWLWAVMSVVALAGCASSGQGGTQALVQVKADTATQHKTVQLQPQTLPCTRTAMCPTLGVLWSSDHPNRATLWVGTAGAQAVVESVEFIGRPFAPLRINAKASQAAPWAGTAAFLVPMDTLERVATSKAAWMRVTTNQGVIEEELHAGPDASVAFNTLQRVVYEAYKGTDKADRLGKGIFDGDNAYAPNYDK